MIAKARVAQLTGLPSITAAAEGPVTFGCFFYRWKARLLSGWGSSLAQGTGGRVRAPAPTAYPKVRLIFCRARCPHRAVPGRPRCAAPTAKTDRARWFGKPRRSCGTAPFEIFRPTGRRRRPPTQSPAQRVCVGEEERWSERALSGRTKRGIRNPRRRSGPAGI